MSKTISVVIPAHNAEETIREAIESVINQSVVPDETVVVCDGCTDGTAVVARKAGAKVIERPKGNGSIARNAGAKAAEGDIYFFLDADDWWQPKKVEKHLEVWDSYKGSFVIDRSTPRNPDGTRSYWTGGLESTGEADWKQFLSHKAWASGSSFSVSRDNYWRIGGFNENLNKFQDVDFWVRSAHESGAAYTLNESLTNYRLSSGSSVSKTTDFIEENLVTLFEGWPFTTDKQREAFRSHAFLMAAEVTPWPACIEYFKKAHWPIGRRYFWKCFIKSMRVPSVPEPASPEVRQK